MVGPIKYLFIFAGKLLKTKIMKKKGNLMTLFALGMSMTLSSCFENAGDHYTEILYPATGIKTLYADQTEDSLNFVTFDDWKLDTTYSNVANSQKLMLSLNPSDLSGTVEADHYVRKSIKFQFSPNTADTLRVVNFKLKAYNTEFGAVYQQVHFHDIERPKRLNYEFLLTDTAEALLDSVIFQAYSDWTLKVKDEAQTPWISVATPSGKKGTHSVRINLEKNTGNANRSATLILESSNAATTEIKLIQEKFTAEP